MPKRRKSTKKWGRIGAPRSETRRRWLSKIRPKGRKRTRR